MALRVKQGFPQIKNWMRNNQITLINVSVTIILVATIVVALLSQAAGLQRRTTEESYINLAGKTAAEIQSYYMNYFTTVQSIARMVSDYGYIDADQRRRYVNDILMGMLNANRAMVSVYSVWKPNELDGMDAAFISAAGSDEAGQFLGGFTRERGGIEQRAFSEYKHLLDIDFIALERERGTVSEPESRLIMAYGNVWTLEIQVPIIVGPFASRRMIGVVGATVNLRTIQMLMELIMPREIGSAMLCSASGTIVAHSDSRLQGTKWADYMASGQAPLFSDEDPDRLFQSVLASISNQEYELVSSGSSMFISYPIKVNDLNAVMFDANQSDNPPWAFVTAIPLSMVMAPINALLRFSILFIITAGIVMLFVVLATSRSLTQHTKNLQRALEQSTIMQDNLKYGLFLMDKNFVIQGVYSKALEKILGVSDLQGKPFLDLLSSSVKESERQGLADYFEMIFNRAFDKEMLENINPLSDFTYISVETGETKSLRSSFSLASEGSGAGYMLATLEDISAEKELQKQIRAAESTRENEMRSIFQVIQLDPRVLTDFVVDAEYEFENINEMLKNRKELKPDVLVDMYQSVHAIKANAIILNLEFFSERLHRLEDSIRSMREKEEDIPFDEFLGLILELNETMKELDQLKITISKIEKFKVMSGGGQNQDRYVLVETLKRACDKAKEALDKKARLVVEDIDEVVLDYGPRRVMKEILTQLVRNAVHHGIESPEARGALGKDPEGEMRLSIRNRQNQIVIKFTDDGGGIDFNRIKEAARASGYLQTNGGADSKNSLLKTIFMPGFSTLGESDYHGGRGVGLSLVRDRVKELRGHISVKTAEGEGTTFTINLPLELPESASASVS